MDDHCRPNDTSSQVLFPDPALADLVFCGVVRDTIGAELSPKNRTNFFPASPMCAITWVLEGTLYPVTGEADQPVMPYPDIFVSGPSTGPTASWSPTELRAVTVCIYADKWSALSEIPVVDLVDRVLPARDLFCQSLFDRLDSLRRKRDANALFQALHQELRREACGDGLCTSPSHALVAGWIKSVTARAALGEAGRGMRQIQRRVKAWTGQSRRSLMAQVRKHTGFSPVELNRLIETDERFWCYRMLGAR